MADDRKKTTNICCKITEQMEVDIARILAVEDLKPSAWLYGLIRRELYGRSLRRFTVDDADTSVPDSD